MVMFQPYEYNGIFVVGNLFTYDVDTATMEVI